MKSLLLASMLIFVSCASNEKSQRNISSSGAAPCEMEKHPNKDWYRIKLHGQAYNNNWYEKDIAKTIGKKIASSGRCTF